MTASEFVRQVKSLRDFYRRNDAYVQRFIPWNDDAYFDKCVLAAYKMFKLVKEGGNEFLPLGDEGIRKMSDLLFNFGLASATGIQDAKLENLVAGLQDQRNLLNAGAPNQIYPQMLGPGAMLSDKTWTTVINDGYIIGGVTGRRNFVLALSAEPTKNTTGTTSEQVLWQRKAQIANRMGINRLQNPLSYHDRWKYQWISFFEQNISMVYTNTGKRQGPRVLARELLGLSFFGYQPHFSEYQLSFEPRRMVPVSFNIYLEKLDRLQFFTNNSRQSQDLVMGAIYDFLSQS